MTALTPEQFMSLPADPPEDDPAPGGDTAWAVPPGPLESIAASLAEIASLGRQHAEQETTEDRYREVYADLEAKHQVLAELVEEISELVKPSTSKLANSVRDAIGRWSSPAAAADPEPAAPEPADERFPGLPSQEAPIEAWLAFAEAQGLAVDPGRTNRSQIRSMLGLPHPVQHSEDPPASP